MPKTPNQENMPQKVRPLYSLPTALVPNASLSLKIKRSRFPAIYKINLGILVDGAILQVVGDVC